MVVQAAVVVTEVDLGNSIQLGKRTLKAPMAGIVADSNLRKLGHIQELGHSFYRRYFVRDVFYNDVYPRKFRNMSHKNVCMLEQEGGEPLSGHTQVHDDVIYRLQVREFQCPLDFVDGLFPVAIRCLPMLRSDERRPFPFVRRTEDAGTEARHRWPETIGPVLL